MSAVLTPGLDAHAAALSAIQRINQSRQDRDNKLVNIRALLKQMPGGLTMSELTDMLACLSVAADRSLKGPIGALVDLAVTFDGAAHYGVESVEWTS